MAGGEYRAISRQHVNAPAVRSMPERARHALLLLKINMGPSGIETAYPGETAARLCAQTGATLEEVEVALDALEASKWIRRESDLLWLMGQLSDDPHIKQSDSKHRVMIQRHVAGLGTTTIVRAYVQAHRGWFAENGSNTGGLVQDFQWAEEGAYEGPSQGPSQGPSSVSVRPFEAPKTEKETETEKESELSSAGAAPLRERVKPAAWVSPVRDRWQSRVGLITPGSVQRHLAPAVRMFGEERILSAIDAYASSRKPGQAAKLEWFASEVTIIVQRGIAEEAEPLVVDGWLSSHGDTATRASA